MTSLRETVTAWGQLHGEGQERRCQVRAVKLTNPNKPESPVYSRPEPIDLDDDFPAGDYELSVGEQRFRLVKRAGKYEWLVRSLPFWQITGVDWVNAADKAPAITP